MIKDIMRENETVTPNSKELQVLKEHFPGCFTAEGSFDLEKFKGILNDQVAVTNEGYELRFLGKNYARLIASTDTTTVIVPNEEHNAKPENANSKNIYISGDNLDGLKHLLKSYEGKVKCIYIDPPYNTGSESFAYTDSFNYTAEELAIKLGIEIEQANRLLDFTRKKSASHSAWLMFIYPRLLKAKDLLSSDGIIFISIDDNECANLKLLCDDVFGESNFIAEFPRVTKRGGKSSETIAQNHDYVLMYSKTDTPLLYPVKHDDKAYKYKDEFFDERGYYKLNQTLDYDSLQYSKSLDYPIELNGYTYYPGSSEELYKERQNGFYDVADWAWRWSIGKFEFGYRNGFIVEKVSRNGRRLYTKTYQKASIEENDEGYYIEYGDRTKSLSTLETTENIYSNDNATKDVANTIGKKVFDHTKPVSLMALLIQLCTKDDDIVLDFFSGSASTAESVLRQNFADKQMRRYIMIQIPEPCKENSTAYKNGYRTICDIGRNRIEKAARNIRSEASDTTVDLGYKHFTLKEPAAETLDKLERFNPRQSTGIIATNTLLEDFGVPTILATWLNHDGYGLSDAATEIDFAGYTGYHKDKHLYLIRPELTDEAITAIVEKMETDGHFNPETVVLFGYSFTWTELDALKNNLSRIRDTEKSHRVNIDIRY